MDKLSPVLIANRGEIACRIIRAAHDMGLRTIAVYSSADQDALHVRLADASICIGAAPPHSSYLNISAIIDAARATGARSVHPGYGFLSENASFARAVEDAGLIFIGPSWRAVDLMGDKAQAKAAMLAAGVPCIPGYQGEDQKIDTLVTKAIEIGFPLMVKAAAGGGGRGMRLVSGAEGLEEAIQLARSEAESAFGNGELILERALTGSRHVEIQVFGDSQGNIIHLAERDCSLQRRHQKVIEEAPCPVMTDRLRREMGETAIRAARAVNYVGAGTVEFLLDHDHAFYFLEMNTRLQVEHPVTEAALGVDLVRMQFEVAAGLPLSIRQDDVRFAGHAIEARIYAENPATGFLPESGPIRLFMIPDGQGVRCDTGVGSGGSVSPYYDPMIAKIIAHGSHREEALGRLLEALQRTVIFGLSTNLEFLIALLRDKHVRMGDVTTRFIDEGFAWDGGCDPTPHAIAAGAAIRHALDEDRFRRNAGWCSQELTNWSSALPVTTVADCMIGGRRMTMAVEAHDGRRRRISFDGVAFDVETRLRGDHVAHVTIEGQTRRWVWHRHQGVLFLSDGASSWSLSEAPASARHMAGPDSGGLLRAPMHGRITALFVQAGSRVTAGDRVAVLEAMKMQHPLLAGASGVVRMLAASVGDQIAAGADVLDIAPDE
jgi:geranyl-CoA carboxylase alpha subunit